MENIFETNKQINAKIGAETEGATTFELVKAQVAKLGGDTSKVVDIRTGEQQVLEHIKQGGGSDVVIQTSKDVFISANGTTVVSPDAGYDAIKDVVVDVNVPDPELEDLFVTKNGHYTPTKYGYSNVFVNVPSKPEQTKSVTITENGTTSVLPDEGNVLNKVDVTVNVPDPELEELSVTANGTYTPTKYGYSKVDVAVPSKPEQTKTVTITENGTTSVLPDEGSVLSNVYVDVNVPGQKPEQTKTVTITENGTTSVLPDEGSVLNKVDVTVNVSGGGGAVVFHGRNPRFSNIEGDFPNAEFPDITSCDSMFFNCFVLASVPLFDTSNVTNMSNMFGECYALTTVPQFDTSKVTNMNHMFNGCSALTTVHLFDTSNVTNMSTMFNGCSALTTVPLFDTSKVTDMNSMFLGCSALTTVPLFVTSNVTNMNSMFYGCKITTLPSFDTSNVTDMSEMLRGCSALTTVPQFNTSNVTNMSGMFTSCKKLTTVPQLDASNVTNISDMFNGCNLLKKFGGLLNIGQAYTSVFEYSLYNCKNLTNESIQNVIDGLYDMTAKGFSPTLKFYTTVNNKLTDAQKQQITSKNWTLV